jgi:hypothetical protein
MAQLPLQNIPVGEGSSGTMDVIGHGRSGFGGPFPGLGEEFLGEVLPLLDGL